MRNAKKKNGIDNIIACIVRKRSVCIHEYANARENGKRGRANGKRGFAW